MPQIRLFTVDEAAKTLPLVKRIVGDIVATGKQLDESVSQRRKLPAEPASGSTQAQQAQVLEREIERLEEDLKRYEAELQALSVELKDYRVGLIDFYSVYEGKIVYLCWKLSEGDQLSWWHDLQAGFRGRRPITPENRARFCGTHKHKKTIELE